MLDFWSDNLLRDVVVLVDNLWQTPDQMYTDLDHLHPVSLRFVNCHACQLDNSGIDFGEYPEEANWGLSEFSLLRCDQVEGNLLRYTFDWENDRKLVISCERMTVEHLEVTPELESRYSFPNLNAKAKR